MSPTLRMAAKARKLRAEGVDVLDFSAGEPDFATPDVVKAAGKRAIDENFTRYTDNNGTIELRRAVAEKLERENGVRYSPEEILVSPGAKASLYCAAMALFGPGDEVIVPSPYWVSHPEQIRLAGATPVFVDATESAGFKLDAARLEAAVTPRTRGIILNYPSNPTGACYDRAGLEALAAVAVRRDLVIVADEIYEKLVYDGRTFTSIASLGEAVRARTVLVNGMSKAFAMTGWRLGYAAAPAEILGAMAKVQSHATSHPASMAQVAGLEALRGAAGDVLRMAAEFERRRNEIIPLLRRIPGVTAVLPEGAFYAFPNVSGLFGRTIAGRPIRSGGDVAELLLERARVAVVPGEAFGSRDHVRFSFACSLEQIRAGMERVAEALA